MEIKNIFGGKIMPAQEPIKQDIVFEREKKRNEILKDRFAYVKSYEFFDLYKHKDWGYYECFFRKIEKRDK